jgi:hypothetical protein
VLEQEHTARNNVPSHTMGLRSVQNATHFILRPPTPFHPKTPNTW